MNKKLNQIVVLVIITLTTLSCKKERVSVNERIMHSWYLTEIGNSSLSCSDMTMLPYHYPPDSVRCIEGVVTGYIDGDSFNYEEYYNNIVDYYEDFQAYTIGSRWGFTNNELNIVRNGVDVSSLACKDGKVFWLKTAIYYGYMENAISITGNNISILWKGEKKYNLQIIKITEDDMILRDNDSNIELYFERKKKQNH
jgi:hypothetical protein